MTAAAQSSRRLAYFAWGAVCIIWGTTYLGIRVSLESIPPALMGGLRWTIAGGLLSLYLLARGRPLPPRSEWGRISLLGFLLLGLGNGGVVFAEQWIPSGLTAVMVATSPFWMAGVEALLPDGERLHRRVIAGLVIGFSGIVLLVWPDLSLGNASGRGFIAGVIAVQIAAIGWSIGSSYSKRQGQATRGDRAAGFDPNSPDAVLGAAAFQMLAGGVMMTAVGTLRGEWSDLFFTVAHEHRARLHGDARRRRRLRRLHLRAAAPAGVVRVALRLHQPGDRSRAGDARAARAVHLAHGDGSRAGVCGRRGRAMERPVGTGAGEERDCGRTTRRSSAGVKGIRVHRAHGTIVIQRSSVRSPALCMRLRALPAHAARSHPPSHSAATDQSHQEQHDRNDQQDVDKVAHGVAADQAEQPQNDQR